MRGLKLRSIFLIKNITLVASFTDAWIETYKNYPAFAYCIVASFTDAWIETTNI